jgi:hypothetical protein
VLHTPTTCCRLETHSYLAHASAWCISAHTLRLPASVPAPCASAPQSCSHLCKDMSPAQSVLTRHLPMTAGLPVSAGVHGDPAARGAAGQGAAAVAVAPRPVARAGTDAAGRRRGDCQQSLYRWRCQQKQQHGSWQQLDDGLGANAYWSCMASGTGKQQQQQCSSWGSICAAGRCRTCSRHS